MQIQEDYQLERAEVGVLLASGFLNRAPNLVLILTYICSKFFEGSQEEIKEYNIAVEALGRPADFDQKRDSIVRVEAHRLRKRLREYYDNEGAGHAVQIEIPAGQYAPRFVVKDALTLQEVAPAVEAAQSEPTRPTDVKPEVQVLSVTNEVLLPPTVRAEVKSRPRWPAATVLTVASIALSAVVTFSLVGHAPIPVGKDLPPTPAGDEIRILAGVVDGSNTYVDAFSHPWSTDRYFSGGTVVLASSAHPIAGTRDPRLYQTRREGAFSYDIPLERGVYELRMHFAETLYGDNNIAGGGETSRIFRISVNGRPLLNEFDVIEDVGPSTADIKVFKDVSPASDGKLHLRFEPGTNPAFLNGIEIVPGIAGRMHPIRMVARDRGFGDKSGRFWNSDRYVRGGQLVVRNEPVISAEDPELYRGERFGNITYTIPVAQPGRYCLRLYFVESWFGPDRPGGGGERSRIFDILCNGVALRRNFDIYKEAGGLNRAVTLSFHGLEPSPQGKLVISLTPSRNYASINALEVLDESN